MKIRMFAGRHKDLLWHPVETPRAFLCQTHKRWLSIAHWYLARLRNRRSRAGRRGSSDMVGSAVLRSLRITCNSSTV